MLKKRVLEAAINVINEKTPMDISYELLRNGRKVTEVIFLVKGNYNRITKDEVNSQIVQNLKGFGFKDKTINQLLKNHDDDYILANIAVVEEAIKRGKKIRNVRAYLMSAFEVDFSPVKTDTIELINSDKSKEELLK